MFGYCVNFVQNGKREFDAAWDEGFWKNLPEAELKFARQEGAGFVPQVKAKLGYDSEALYALFEVRDRYVRCVVDKPQSEVSGDSCVEVFFQPAGNKEYFDFELTAAGTPLLTWVTDHRIIDDQLAGFTPLDRSELAAVKLRHSMPFLVDPELDAPTTWYAGFAFPFAVMAHYGKFEVPVKGTVWRANLYHCGDNTSHPRWLSWQELPMLNFHLPETFGELKFC